MSPRSGATLRNVRAIFSRAASSSCRVVSRTAFGSWPSATSCATRCATLWTIDIAGWASEMRRAASARSLGSGRPLASMIASGITSRASRASFDAPLVRSSAIPWTASSTDGGSMFHPFVIGGEARDARPDATLEEVPRIALRGAAAHLVQLPQDALRAFRGEALPHHPRPRRVGDHHGVDRLLRIRVRPIVAEEEGPRFEGEDALQRLEVLAEIERRRRGDRHEDLVSGEVESRRISRVHASISLVEDREFVRRVTRRVKKPQRVLAEL